MTLRHRVTCAGLAVLLAGPLSLFAPATALADPATELEQASQRLEELGGQLTEAQAQLADAVSQLEETDYGVAEKQGEVDATRTELSGKQASLGLEMRSSYKGGTTSLLDFVLGSTSAEDLVSRIYYLDKISEQKAAAIEEVRDLAEQLEAEMAELEGRQATQEDLVASLRSQVSDYESRVAEARSVYDALDAEAKAALAAQQSENVAAAVEAVENDQAQQEASGGDAPSASDPGQTGDDLESPNQDQPEQQPEAPSQPEEPDEPAQPEEQPSQPETPSAPSGGGVSTALAQVGKAYVYGTAGPNTFDCSGLVCYSYGYALGRSTFSMISSLQSSGRWKTSMDQLSYGDLVFPSEGHVGIYLGNGTMVHASTPSTGVVIGPVYSFIGGGSYY